MISENSNIETLNEFAKASGRTIESHETPYPLSGIRQVQKFKRIAVIPNNSQKTSYFICYSDPYGHFGDTTIFCGTFILLDSAIASKLEIRKKSFIDKLSFGSKSKLGHDFFDSKVVIKGRIRMSEQQLLMKPRVQNGIIEALNSDKRLHVGINEYKMNFVEEFKGCGHLGIINTMNWNLEPKYIEKQFELIEKIRLGL